MIALAASPTGRLTALLGCTFLGYGVSVPYLSRWLAEAHGLSGVEIAIVTSSAALSRLVVGPLIAAWADGRADRRTPLRLLALGAALATLAFAAADGFWALAAAGFLASTFSAALGPLIEGAALRASQTGPIPFGVSRAIGSAAFVVGNLLGGALLIPFGIGVVVVWMAAASVLAAAVAWFGLASDPAPAAARGRSFAARMRTAPELLANRRYLLAFLAGGAIQSAHAFFYGFSVLVWTRQGLSEGVIGGLWATGVLVEIAGLAALPWIERRIRPEALIALGGAGAAVRWTAFAFSPPEALLWPLQGLHALTFAATHVGCLRVIQRETPEAAAGVGQSLYAAFAAGTALGLASILSGWLYDTVGALGYLAMAGLGLVGFGLSCALWRAGR